MTVPLPRTTGKRNRRGWCRMCSQETFISRHHLLPKRSRRSIARDPLTVPLCFPCHDSLHLGDRKVEATESLWEQLTIRERDYIRAGATPGTFFYRRVGHLL